MDVLLEQLYVVPLHSYKKLGSFPAQLLCCGNANLYIFYYIDPEILLCLFT